MKEEFTLLGKIFCHWLEWHLPNWKKHWHHGGRIHAPCKLCRKIISVYESGGTWK